MKKSKGRKVYQYDLDNNLIGIFDGITEASEKTGCNRVDIGYCCRHVKGNNTVNGFYWRYEEDVSPLEKNKRKKAVKQMNSETHELINEFESITRASKEVGENESAEK